MITIKKFINKIHHHYNQYLKKKGLAFDSFIKQAKLTAKKYNQNILSPFEANQVISDHIISGQPFLVSRFGSGELRCIHNYLFYTQRRKKILWHDQVLHEMYNYGGIFPQNGEMLKTFSEIYLDSIKHIDVLGIWYNVGENETINKYCPKSKLIPLSSIEPYFHKNPWSMHLKGKKVLVIHPFSESIEKQYKIKERLFEDPDILPDFELITYKTPITLPGEQTQYNSWSKTLFNMKKDISQIEFDLAIIGAGPYGLPLGAYIKTLGKQAIHIGGATQILFGIKGKRWEENERFKKFFNKNWTYPLENETPQSAKDLEGGCYWKKN